MLVGSQTIELTNMAMVGSNVEGVPSNVVLDEDQKLTNCGIGMLRQST